MGRVYADIPGFKKLDEALRSIASECTAARNELEARRAARRTADELAALAAVERELQLALEHAKQARAVLWDGVVSNR